MSIDEIIAGMSGAQKRAVLASVDYDDGSALFRLGSGRGMCPLGLGRRTIDGIELTALGLAVRARLEETND